MGLATNAGPLLSHSLSAAACGCGSRNKFNNIVIDCPLQSYPHKINGRNFVTIQSSSSDATVSLSSEENLLSFPLTEIKATCKTWLWRGHTINYLVYPPAATNSPSNPLLLVHGFGASVSHWRRYRSYDLISLFSISSTDLIFMNGI